jgi:hypothetical protein
MPLETTLLKSGRLLIWVFNPNRVLRLALKSQKYEYYMCSNIIVVFFYSSSPKFVPPPPPPKKKVEQTIIRLNDLEWQSGA